MHKYIKLDGVGPVDNRPSTNELHHFVKKKKIKKNVTCDTWHMTCDMWWRLNILSKCQVSSLTIWEGRWFEDLEEKVYSLNRLMN